MLCELHQECEYGWKSREVDRENAGQVVHRALPHYIPASRGAPALHRPCCCSSGSRGVLR